jgi:hypothetical protein
MQALGIAQSSERFLDELEYLIDLPLLHPERRDRRRPQPEPAGAPGRAGIKRDLVSIAKDPGPLETLRHLRAVAPERGDVDGERVLVHRLTDDRAGPLSEPQVAKPDEICLNLTAVDAKRLGSRFLQSRGQAGQDHQIGTSLGHRIDRAVHLPRVQALAKDHCRARATQGLVGRQGRDINPRHRIWDHTRRDQARGLR